VIVVGQAEGYRSFSSLLEGDLLQAPGKFDIDCTDAVVALPFSSGTSGLPKGVMLTHSNLVSNILQSVTPSTLNYRGSGECMITILPFFHIYGQISVSMTALATGSKTISLPKFEPHTYLESIRKYSPTVLHVVPPLMLFLARHPIVEKYNFSCIHDLITAAAPCSKELMNEVGNKLNKNMIVRQGYGLTEASPLTHFSPQTANKLETVGPVVQNTEFKIVDPETGNVLGQGQEGELLVRGPQVMKGYYKNEKATAEALVDGWLHTGDIGYYDEDKYLVTVDRIKELIKVKGFQVAPAELEALLLSHEAVVDAAVIGKPDERLGEAPVAYVVLRPNYKPSDDMVKQLQTFVADRVAPIKRLSGGIVFREAIPKSESGKILRKVLRQQL